jgi:hypothetical protein
MQKREKTKEWQRKYNAEHKEHLSEKRKEWVKNNPERVAQYTRNWVERNREKKRASNNAWHLSVKKQVIEHYGGKCECCGEGEFDFLSIDHINGGGNKHRALIYNHIYIWLRQNNYPSGFRVLCHNCNMSRAFTGSCPHERNRSK